MTHAWDTLITGAAFVMKVNKPKGISAGNEGNLRDYTCIYERLLWWPCGRREIKREKIKATFAVVIKWERATNLTSLLK